MQAVSNTLLSENFLPFWVFLLMLCIERFLQWPEKYHPLSFIRLLAKGMHTKVLHPQQNSPQQQKIAGALAGFILLLPMIAIFAVVKYFSEFPIFFDGLMLLIALRFQDIPKHTRRISVALSQQKKILARQSLSHLVLRETEKMSPLGMVKANIESLLLRFSYQFCSVLFWYVIAGGMGALIYRLTYELSLCWNTKLVRFTHFGSPIRFLVNILQWIPSKIATLSIVLAVNTSRGIAAVFQRISYQSNHLFVLNVCGASLNIELGGPAYYDHKKVRVIKCGGTKPAILRDNSKVLGAINRAIWIILVAYFVLSTIAFILFR